MTHTAWVPMEDVFSFNSTKVRLWHLWHFFLWKFWIGFNSTKVRLWRVFCFSIFFFNLFQFYKSAIMTLWPSSYSQHSYWFQFYKSAIMTSLSSRKQHNILVSILQKCDYDIMAEKEIPAEMSFNSTKVRLWRAKVQRWQTNNPFQFYKSAIMTIIKILVLALILRFNSTKVRLWPLLIRPWHL